VLIPLVLLFCGFLGVGVEEEEDRQLERGVAGGGLAWAFDG